MRPFIRSFIRRRLHPLLSVPVLLSVAACGNYDITVNERKVYTPAPLFSDFNLADPALQQCVKQAVIDQKVTAASGLKILNCSHAGVGSLAGLEIFTGLSHLRLSSNAIVDLAPLSSMSSLVTLQLDQNQIRDTAPLLELRSLQELNLLGNSQLLCPSGQSFTALEVLSLPKQCKS